MARVDDIPINVLRAQVNEALSHIKRLEQEGGREATAIRNGLWVYVQDLRKQIAKTTR